MKDQIQLFPAPRTLTLKDGCYGSPDAIASTEIPVHPSEGLPEQGYRLIITPDNVEIHANTDAAAFYAGQTLKQVVEQTEGSLPCLEIEDWPDIPVRGLMLDVSRCNVPTMETLLDLVDWMASVKLNQFQLYIEHTFAFPGHEIVWESASPLTGDEIQALDAYCRERHIELVPNLNSFGHMERWLRHAPYRHLAECPDGFYSPLLKKQFTQGTTLFPGKESADFMASLYDAYLPHFSSQSFNVGGDEPWELGVGRSAERVEAIGKGRVYLDFMKEIHKRVVERDHRMMCWADIFMDHPEIIPDIPGDIIPVIWGYNGDHPFDSQCAKVARHLKQFYVAPGNNTWNSLTGRLDEALTNMKNAAQNAVRHGGTGYLITTWGDNGNHQPWITLFPGILQGACSAWAVAQNENPDLATYFDTCFFEDAPLGNALIRLGRIDKSLPFPNPQHPSGWSPTHYYLFTDPQILKDRLEEMDSIPGKTALSTFIEEAGQFLAELEALHASGKDALALAEMVLGLKLALAGARRAGSILHGWEDTEWLRDLETLRETYQQYWLKRARPGGLEESMTYFDTSAKTGR